MYDDNHVESQTPCAECGARDWDMFDVRGEPWTRGGLPIVDWHLARKTTWTGDRLMDRCRGCGLVVTTDDL